MASSLLVAWTGHLAHVRWRIVVTYPFLPVIPIATSHFGGKAPSLPPQQKQHPESDEQMRKAQEAARGQVLLDQRGEAHGDIAQAYAVWPIPKRSYPSRRGLHLGCNVFEDGLEVGLARLLVLLREAVASITVAAVCRRHCWYLGGFRVPTGRLKELHGFLSATQKPIDTIEFGIWL